MFSEFHQKSTEKLLEAQKIDNLRLKIYNLKIYLRLIDILPNG